MVHLSAAWGTYIREKTYLMATEPKRDLHWKPRTGDTKQPLKEQKLP
jgi:hypothetical protein